MPPVRASTSAHPIEEKKESWAAIYHRRVLQCVLLCSRSVIRVTWRNVGDPSAGNRLKYATLSDARRRGTRRIGPSAPRRTDSDLLCCFTSNAAKVGPRGCTLCVLCHRTARGALQTRLGETGVWARPDPSPRAGYTSPAGSALTRSLKASGQSDYRETKCVLVCT